MWPRSSGPCGIWSWYGTTRSADATDGTSRPTTASAIGATSRNPHARLIAANSGTRVGRAHRRRRQSTPRLFVSADVAGQQLVASPARGVVVRDSDNHQLVGLVVGYELVEGGRDGVRRPDDGPGLRRGRVDVK